MALIDCLEVHNAALAWLKSLGFIVRSVSMTSEACYLAFPGRRGLLRVASHKGGPPLDSHGEPVVFRLTLCPDHGKGLRRVNNGDMRHHLEGAIIKAVGTYFVNSKPTSVEG